MKYLIIDERMRKIEKGKLEQLGYKLIEIKQSNSVYPEISAHVDIFTCKIGSKLIVEPSQYNQIKTNLSQEYNIEQGTEKIGKNYPYDIKYNICTIGKKAIHNFEHTEPKIKEELIKQEYEIINTTQGYTNCSIAIIDDNSAIVTDKGLYKILKKHKVDILYLDYEPNIKLLDGYKYSSRKGFIGGAISQIDKNIIVFGDLNRIDKDGKIRKFVEQRNLSIIDFEELDVIDYGGLVQL